MTTIEGTLDATEGETIRVPRNIMGLLRQSYDTREKILDWMLAFFVAFALAWMFRDQIMAYFAPDPDPNAGRDDPPVPSQNVDDAIPPGDRLNAKLYTYNLPPSRSIRWHVGPNANPPPANPSNAPVYP